MSRPVLTAALLTSLALAGCALLGRAQAGGGGGPRPARPQAALCRADYVRPSFARLEADLASARARWAAQRARAYRYDFAQVAAPVRYPAVRVTVRPGAAPAIAVLPGEVGDPGGQAGGTVEARFAQVAQALASWRTQPCPEVRVTYDRVTGVPLTFYGGSGLANIADGYGEWRVTNFTRG
ncbi:DUF6174 domain-containing protein [Deinococcus petrolearius]|uniref:DUF6174 domain-containing protein n=1 Tax=Deinococcus petrolearius TaxID=1751295 RepID=A0ABW1DMP3_9DEIO